MTIEHFHIREATSGDEQNIARVHIAAWRVANAGIMPATTLDALNVEECSASWRSRFEDPENVVYVAELEGEIAGFGCLSPSRDDEPRVAEIQSLYLHPEHWRRGGGDRLLSRLMRCAREQDYEQVTLWVLSANERARAFYKSTGFTGGDTRKTDCGFCEIPLDQVRYRIRV